LECRTIEHTADIGIEVEAGSLEELFAGAASGMFSLIVDPATVSQADVREVSLKASDLGELMFLWLNELIYLSGATELLLSSFTVKRIEGFALEAEVKGEPADPRRHRMRQEVKAATYHELVVEERGEGWFARVIFDV
jgi:protein archease